MANTDCFSLCFSVFSWLDFTADLLSFKHLERTIIVFVLFWLLSSSSLFAHVCLDYWSLELTIWFMYSNSKHRGSFNQTLFMFFFQEISSACPMQLCWWEMFEILARALFVPFSESQHEQTHRQRPPQSKTWRMCVCVCLYVLVCVCMCVCVCVCVCVKMHWRHHVACIWTCWLSKLRKREGEREGALAIYFLHCGNSLASQSLMQKSTSFHKWTRNSNSNIPSWTNPRSAPELILLHELRNSYLTMYSISNFHVFFFFYLILIIHFDCGLQMCGNYLCWYFQPCRWPS